MLHKAIERLTREWLLIGSLMGLLGTSWWRGRFPAYSVTDFHVVYILLVFLVVIKGLECSRFLETIAMKVQRGRRLPFKLVLLTGLLSMFVTNDVALLTMVPLTLSLNMERRHILVILEALSANAGSALTPFGNPQNIFIFYHYHVPPTDFVRSIIPFTLVFLCFILWLAWREGDGQGAEACLETENDVDGRGYLYAVFFIVFVVAVLRYAPLWLGLFPLVYALIGDRRSLRIDWALLLTFLAFFGFTDNLVHLLRFDLRTPLRTFLYAAIGSQVISNVPGALLFADFTHHWRSLLWGVSVGGFGNLIGSLASLIAYRLYRARYPGKEFLLPFHLYGYAAFSLGIGVYLIMR